MKLVIVCGARPNFMKVAPIMWALRERTDFEAVLVHTGQHYDRQMSQLFFEELRIPAPDVNLNVGSGSHAVQTAEVMKRFEPVVLGEKPDAVVVVGDVNSTLACALTSVKLDVPVAHVEAGLRSGDRSMPEEINRIVTDAISRWLFVSERGGVTNLRREGVPDERIFFVGNTMIDSLIASRDRCRSSDVVERLGLTTRGYAVLTLHRPSNVDDPATFDGILRAVEAIQRRLPIVFPVHPRTRSVVAGRAERMPGLHMIDPLGYVDFMRLVSEAAVVLTDSGGVQEETTVLGIPCLTLRENTERPATVEEGTNLLVGRDPERIVAAAERVLSSGVPSGRVPELWDGSAAPRILDVLAATEGRAI